MHDRLVALVTGANKGIGLQIAKDLASRGFTALIGTRSLAKADEAAKGVKEDARSIQFDVTDQTFIAAAAGHIREEFSRLDVLVNNAGIAHAASSRRSLVEIMQSGRASGAGRCHGDAEGPFQSPCASPVRSLSGSGSGSALRSRTHG